MAEPSPQSSSLTMFDRLALATLLVVTVLALGWVVRRNTGLGPVADTFQDIEKSVAQRRIAQRLPAAEAAEAAHHALRLSRLGLQLARAQAVDAEVADLVARYSELQKWTLEQLDDENRARLDRRLRAIETDPVLVAAQATFAQRQDMLPPEATASAQSRLQQAQALRDQVYGALDQALAQADSPARKPASSEQCVQCHRGIDRAELDRATLAQLSDPEESKRLSQRLGQVRDLLARRAAVDPQAPTLQEGQRLGSVPWVLVLMLLSTAVAAISLGLLERSWRVGLNATYAGIALSVVTSGALATFTPAVPRVEPVPLTEAQIKQYCAHPRLDLYVGANSPHPLGSFACADCHHGQGKATTFAAAGHQPSDTATLAAWMRDHGWQATDCGPASMLATRFTQASCLKCHPQVSDTIRHGVQEEAPKLLAGKRLFEQLGCQGCHALQGPALESRPVGPSLRRVSEKLEESWMRRWLAEPRAWREHTLMPHFYGLSNNHPDVLPAEQKAFPAVEIAAISHYLHSESQRALRGEDQTSQQLHQAWQQALAQLSQQPASASALQTLRHLLDQLHQHARRQQPLATTALEDIHRQMEGLLERYKELPADAPERAGLLTQLATLATQRSRFDRAVPLSERLIDADGASVTLDLGRKGNKVQGRLLFTEKGCLACHRHTGTTKALKVDGQTAVYSVRSEAQHGPDLSRLQEKFAGLEPQQARRWLVQWLLNPRVHSPETLMPITHLSIEQADDIASWLLSVKPSEPASVADPGEPAREDLLALARQYLAEVPGLQPADLQPLHWQGQTLHGLPTQRLAQLPESADERRLLAERVTSETLQWYVGKKAIARLGCYGCHDIPGFETAKPNSVPLSDWGRKQLPDEAFAGLAEYFRHNYAVVPRLRGNTRAEVTARLNALQEKFDAVRPAEKLERDRLKAKLEAHERLLALETKAATQPLSEAEKQEYAQLQPQRLFEAVAGKQPYEELFIWALEQHQREGYLSAKLTDPRAADVGRERAWLERRVMPQYRFARPLPHKGEEQEAFASRVPVEEATAREAVMTFVLGLVRSPVATAKLPDPRRDAAIEARGRAILDKYNCASCHQIQPGVYEFMLTPELRERLLKDYNRAALEDAASWLKDHLYAGHSAWTGTPPQGERLRAYGLFDAQATEMSGEGKNDVIYLTEALRVPTAGGDFRDLRAGMFLSLPRGSYHGTPGYGGVWTELMIPYLARKDPSNFPLSEPGKARGVLAPPLLREGERVQAPWLYQFLLEPSVIRPENYMLLRMPRFALRPEEAQALVDYFTVVARRHQPDAALEGSSSSLAVSSESYWKQQSERYEAAARAKLAEVEAALKDPAQKAQHPQLQKLAQGIQQRLAPGPGTAYERAAFQLLTDKNLCISCHNVGPILTPAPKGPNLALAAQRLKPLWTEQWIANPRRLFAYSPLMPQNFPNTPHPLEWQYQDLFVGSPLQQTRASRDLIMDLARLNRQAPTYKPPVPPPASGENK